MNYQNNLGNEVFEWPYSVDYDKVNHIETDIVIVGASFAGCCAGLSAARRGFKVAVCDKAPIKRSGCGGAGMDHWNGVFDGPQSPVTPEDLLEKAPAFLGQGHRDYIAVKGIWAALMELERLGLPIRDEDDDFAGHPTRDEETKILKAYDYKNLVSVKLRGGHYIKPTLYYGLKNEENATLYERVMITNLLTEFGKQGTKIVGATGFSLETGEFYVFHAKAAILCSGYVCSCWIYSTEITGNSYRWDPNDIGEGMAMAWKAGAEVYGMYKNGTLVSNHPFAWPRFGVGNPSSTWYPCTMVDDNGKVIPWQHHDGSPVTTVEARNLPLEDQPFNGGGLEWRSYDGKPLGGASLIRDIGKRIRDGEYTLPLWADLAGMPEKERRSIWGVMIGNEGKSRYTLYDYYTRNGFNPDTDMLMSPIQTPETYPGPGGWFGGEPFAVKPWRTERGGQGELGVDWDLMTSVPGLFCAGAAAGQEGSSYCCAGGFYAGNRAAEYCMNNNLGEIDAEQLDAEYNRVYAPIKRAEDPKNYISWKELWGGSTRAMQQCCTDFKTISVLKLGLQWLDSIKNTEMQMTFARNPHELARVLEGETRITCSEAFLHCCLNKLEAENAGVGDDKYIFNRLDGDKVITIVKDDKYWLKPPYAPTYLENYNLRKAHETDAAKRGETVDG